MSRKKTLKGITWGHSRGYTPLVAAAQRFEELHPQIEIEWKKRTLQEFADFPIETLTRQYDLLIIDHPWVGCAAETNTVLALDKYLPESFMNNQLVNSVGCSHESYFYKGHQWALAIDAATPVASYRADLFTKNNISVPATWQEVIALAKKGKVAVPAIPIDLLMNFYMFCIAHGSEPFTNSNTVVDKETGIGALQTMKELWSLVDKKMFHCNPIAIAELMTTTDDYWYCPFAYGYSNYSRTGYTNNPLTYDNLVQFNDSVRLRSTIGGTGLAISSFSKNMDWALRFAEWVVSGEIQSTLYVQHGGQPGHKSAWTNNEANILCNNFYKNTLQTLDEAFLRPRYNNYLFFQDHAGLPIYEYLINGGSAEKVLMQINVLYHNSLQR